MCVLDRSMLSYLARPPILMLPWLFASFMRAWSWLFFAENSWSTSSFRFNKWDDDVANGCEKLSDDSLPVPCPELVKWTSELVTYVDDVWFFTDIVMRPVGIVCSLPDDNPVAGRGIRLTVGGRNFSRFPFRSIVSSSCPSSLLCCWWWSADRPRAVLAWCF